MNEVEGICVSSFRPIFNQLTVIANNCFKQQIFYSTERLIHKKLDIITWNAFEIWKKIFNSPIAIYFGEFPIVCSQQSALN